jgi:alpha-mannosidase
VIVSAIKKSENGDDIIIRCVETSGQPASATIDLRFANRKWSGSFRPCEIKTLLFKQDAGTVAEVSLLEE